MKITAEELDRAEILHYLATPPTYVDEELQAEIDRAVQIALQVANIRTVYKVVDIEFLAQGVQVVDTNLLLEGKAICEHLKNSKKIVVMALTLGLEIEKTIFKTKYKNLSDAFILDAVASALIEQACNNLQLEIHRALETSHPGFYQGKRFSPGYADLPLTVQPQVLRLLEANKQIGLTCNDENIMIPRKSVTAFVGLYDEEERAHLEKDVCADCLIKENCQKRKAGFCCGA